MSNSISRVIVDLSISIIYGPIIEPHDNQLLVGLIAQLVEHCTGIAEVRVRIPVQALLVTTTK